MEGEENIILQGFSILVLKRNTVLFLEQSFWQKETVRTCTPRPCDMCLFSLNINLRLKGGKMGGYSAFGTLVPLLCVCVCVWQSEPCSGGVGADAGLYGGQVHSALQQWPPEKPSGCCCFCSKKGSPRRRAFYSRHPA